MQTETQLTAARLAKHIMGWHESDKMTFTRTYTGPLPVFCDYGDKVLVLSSGGLWEFNPFEKIEHAWEIVEAIHKKSDCRLELLLCTPAYRKDPPKWRARFARSTCEQWAYSETAQYGICHAAYVWWLEYAEVSYAD